MENYEDTPDVVVESEETIKMDSDATSVDINPDPEKQKEHDNMKLVSTDKKIEKKHPNVFIAVEVKNPEIIQRMQEVQNEMVVHNSELERHAMSLKKVHATLLAFNAHEEELPKARAVLERTLRTAIKELGETSFILEVQGMNTFNDRVVFADIKEGSGKLAMMNQHLRKAFQDAGFDCDSKFAPHITLMKMRFRHKGSIPRASYQGSCDKVFGEQIVVETKLLSMTKPQTFEGQYYSEGEYNFKDVLDRENRMSSKDIKEENALVASQPALPDIEAGATKRRRGEERLRPNVFLAVKIPSEEICSGIADVQTLIGEFSPPLKKLAVQASCSHVTLMVTNVQDDQMERAKDLMKETLKSNVNIMKKFDVEVKGLGSFGDRVVFAEVGAGADVLKELNKVFSAAFKIYGFEVDSRSYTPHITIMKGGKITKNSYKEMTERRFGTQEISGVQLLSMMKPHTEDGYYHCEGEFRFEDLM